MEPESFDSFPLLASFDTAKVEELRGAYQEHVGGLLRVVARVVGNWWFAEDIVQDVFVSLLRDPAAMGEGEAVRRRLMVRARSRAIDLHRREEARRRNEHRNFIVGDLERGPVNDATVSAATCDLRDALRRLPDAELHPIVLAYFAGQTYREVALTLEVPEGTVKTRIRAGLQRLRRLLEDGKEHHDPES